LKYKITISEYIHNLLFILTVKFINNQVSAQDEQRPT